MFCTDDSVDNSDPKQQMISDLEIKGVKAAEGGDIQTAMKAFNEAITKEPNRASCYNNRAQALRLMGKIEGISISNKSNFVFKTIIIVL